MSKHRFMASPNGMDRVRSVIREEIAEQIDRDGSWDHAAVLAAAIGRLHPFTHLDLENIVAYGCDQCLQSIARGSGKAAQGKRRAFQVAYDKDGRRVNKPVQQLTLFELSDVIDRYREGIYADTDALRFYESLFSECKRRIGSRDITATHVADLLSDAEIDGLREIGRAAA